MPVGDQAAGQVATVELVLPVQRDLVVAADIVPDAYVIERAMEGLGAFETATYTVLLLAEHQGATGDQGVCDCQPGP